jgi:hypothetical protein
MALLVAAVALAGPAPEKIDRTPKPVPEAIEGIWQSQDGKALVTIRPRADGLFVQWNKEDLMPDMGIGMRKGSVLYVGYQTAGGNNPSIVRYELQGGKLVGLFMGPDGKMGSETLERVK